MARLVTFQIQAPAGDGTKEPEPAQTGPILSPELSRAVQLARVSGRLADHFELSISTSVAVLPVEDGPLPYLFAKQELSARISGFVPVYLMGAYDPANRHMLCSRHLPEMKEVRQATPFYMSFEGLRGEPILNSIQGLRETELLSEVDKHQLGSTVRIKTAQFPFLRRTLEDFDQAMELRLGWLEESLVREQEETSTVLHGDYPGHLGSVDRDAVMALASDSLKKLLAVRLSEATNPLVAVEAVRAFIVGIIAASPEYVLRYDLFHALDPLYRRLPHLGFSGSSDEDIAARNRLTDRLRAGFADILSEQPPPSGERPTNTRLARGKRWDEMGFLLDAYLDFYNRNRL